MKCPVCNEIMVEIVYGTPNWETAKKARQRKVFIGGCIVSEKSTKYHCYQCKKSFSEDLKTSVNESEDWLLK